MLLDDRKPHEKHRSHLQSLALRSHQCRQPALHRAQCSEEANHSFLSTIFGALPRESRSVVCVYNHTPKGQVVVLNVDHKSARVTVCNMEITFLKTQMLALHSGEWLLQIDPQLYSPFTICRSRAQTKYPLTQRQLLTLVRPERLRCRNLN